MFNYRLLLRRLSALLLCLDWNLLAIMAPEDMPVTITMARETFVPITGKLNDNNLLCLRECLMPIILGIPYNTEDVNHNIWGILSSDAAYKLRHHKVFAPTTQPVVYLIIPDNATSVVRSCTDTFHKLLGHDFKLHEAAKVGCHTFIIDAVKDTWIHKIRHRETMYANVTTKALMNHLQLRCGGLHVLNNVDLTSEMLTYYDDAAGVPKYTNMLEDNHKKGHQTELPLSDVTIVAIATRSILQYQAFTPEMKE